MNKTKRWIGNLLIISGFVLLIMLGLGMKSSQDNQNELIEAFEAVKTEASTGTAAHSTVSSNSVEKAEMPDGVEGILTIPAIQLNAPVLEGATTANLDKALGSISGLDKAGKMDGSYAIAGHQAHVFGKFFNRLNELEKGDRFHLETVNETLDFEVFDIQIVKPEEVSILEPRKGMALISLITCYPENSNKYRLIVQAKRVDY